MITETSLGEVEALRQAVVSHIDASGDDVAAQLAVVRDRLFAVYAGLTRRPSFREAVTAKVESRLARMVAKRRVAWDRGVLKEIIEDTVGEEVVRLSEENPQEPPKSLIAQARSQVEHSRVRREAQAKKHAPWSFYGFLAYRAFVVFRGGGRPLTAPGPEPFDTDAIEDIDADAIEDVVEADGVLEEPQAARARLASVLRVRELAVAGLVLSGGSKEYVRTVFGDRAARDAMALASNRLLGTAA